MSGVNDGGLPPEAELRAASGSAPHTPGVDVEPPPSSSMGLEVPVLETLRPLAVFGLLAMVLGRALAPALAGAWVGMSRLVQGVGLAGAVASQIFALAAMIVAILSVLAASRSRLHLVIRIGALTLGGFAILPTVWALHQPVPDLSAALVGGSAALLALITAPSAFSARAAPFARGPALVIGLVALGGLVRLGAVGLAVRAAAPGLSRLAPAVDVAATFAFLCDTLALAAAVGWIAARSKKLTSPASMVLVAFALLCTRQALAGRAEDLRPLDAMLWRAAARLTSRPDPALPVAFQVFVAFLGPMVAGAALFARDTLGPLGAAVALALCARGSVEMPPCALMLMIAALGLALAAHEGRGLWAVIAAAGPPRGRDDV